MVASMHVHAEPELYAFHDAEHLSSATLNGAAAMISWGSGV